MHLKVLRNSAPLPLNEPLACAELCVAYSQHFHRSIGKVHCNSGRCILNKAKNKNAIVGKLMTGPHYAKT